jgi:lipoprotein NlpI
MNIDKGSIFRRVCPCILLLMLAGCAGMGTRAEYGTQAGREEVRKAAETLLEGIRRYERGDFAGAIATLDEPALRTAPDAMRVEALKYTAFSYCVMENYAQCRHAFDLSLDIDSGFDLRKSERGHPMWGPVFEQAKAASEQDHTHMSADRNRERWRGIDLWRAR